MALPPALLASVDQIDAAWLDTVLAHAGVTAGPVTLVDKAPVGAGTTSSVIRLTLSYKAGAKPGPRTLIAKFPMPSSSGGTADPAVLGYAREVEAYRYFGAAPVFRVPRCYWAVVREDGQFNLVLEDLGEGYRAGDQIAGCSIAEAYAVAVELAGLHATYWNAPGLDALSWPRRRAPVAARSAEFYRHGAAVMRQRFGGDLPERDLALIDRVAELVEPWAAAAPPVHSLFHSDPRVDNIMFGTAGGQVAAWLIDLQQMAVGNPAYDLAYFLNSSLEPAVRAASERAVVGVYAQTIRAAGHDYDDATAWERHCQQAISALVAAVQAAGGFPDRADLNRLIITMAGRGCAAVGELDGIAAAQRYIAGGV